MKQNQVIILAVMGLMSSIVTLYAHPGRTDSNGGHNDNIHGGYHYHSGSSASSRTFDPLPTNEYNRIGSLMGVDPQYRMDRFSIYGLGGSYRPPQPQHQIVVPAPVRPKTLEEIDRMKQATIAFHVESANKGLPTAQYKLGTYYLHGVNGFPIDKASAMKWFYASALQGNTDAKKAFETLAKPAQH